MVARHCIRMEKLCQRRSRRGRNLVIKTFERKPQISCLHKQKINILIKHPETQSLAMPKSKNGNNKYSLHNTFGQHLFMIVYMPHIQTTKKEKAHYTHTRKHTYIYGRIHMCPPIIVYIRKNAKRTATTKH